MYAIVETGGKQIRVAPGDTVVIDALLGDVNAEVVMDKVLMISTGDKAVFGTPHVEGARVTAEVVKTGKMSKILVMKHVPKKAHEKLTGHRQPFTTLRVKEIIGG